MCRQTLTSRHTKTRGLYAAVFQDMCCSLQRLGCTPIYIHRTACMTCRPQCRSSPCSKVMQSELCQPKAAVSLKPTRVQQETHAHNQGSRPHTQQSQQHAQSNSCSCSRCRCQKKSRCRCQAHTPTRTHSKTHPPSMSPGLHH